MLVQFGCIPSVRIDEILTCDHSLEATEQILLVLFIMLYNLAVVVLTFESGDNIRDEM